VEEKDEPGRAHHSEESTRKEIQDTYSVNPEMRSPVGDLGREVLGSNVGDISPGLLIEVAAKRASAAPGGGGGREGSDGSPAAEFNAVGDGIEKRESARALARALNALVSAASSRRHEREKEREKMKRLLVVRGPGQ
jgi:hypothetical protein